MDDVSVS